MNPLDMLFLLSGVTVVMAFFCGRMSWGGSLLTVLYGVQLLALVYLSPMMGAGAEISSGLYFSIAGFYLHWMMTPLAWLFALMTLLAGLLCSAWASGAWGLGYRDEGHSLRLLHLAIALNVAGMLLLLTSANLLVLFICWELMSWSGLLLMVQGGAQSVRAALRYLPYAMLGAMSLLAAVALVYSATGQVGFDNLTGLLVAGPAATAWLLTGLLVTGFGVKMAMLPFHLWQPAAYSETPGPGAAFLGSISSRMGLFAMALVLVRMSGPDALAALLIAQGPVSAQDVLLLLSAATIIVGAYEALRQDDARYLLVWSGISQGGFMMLGLFSGSSLAMAGGLSHAFSYFSYEAGLLLVVFAVLFRTGTTDLNRLGGLVTRMPLSFLVLLMGIIGLAGLPPINGFVSKWMIYRGLLDQGRYVYFLIAVVGTLGSVLYCYKLIHNLFLGQLRKEHQTIREAPWSMTVPMLVLAVMMFVTGYLPGLVLQPVADAMRWMGVQPPEFTLGAIHVYGADLDMLWLVSFMLVGFAIGALIFYAGGRTQRVHQLDNYAGGHFLTADTRYQYSFNFYPALARVLAPLYRDSFLWLESGLVSMLSVMSGAAQGFYRSVHPSLYLLVAVVLGWMLAGGH